MKPPPAVLLLLAFGAGLATGLARFGAPVAVAMVLGLAVVATRRTGFALWFAAILAGRGSAALAWWSEAGQCRSRLGQGTMTLDARLVEPVFPDSRLARVAPHAGGCRGTVSARWPAGLTVPAGTEARLTARWLPGPDSRGHPDGLLLISAAASLSLRPTPAEALRNWVGRTIGRLYGARAGTVDALIVNRRGAMPPELRDRYARAGLVHILSISGFHVGIILGWVVLLLRVAGLPGPRAGILAALVAAAYVAFLGWPPPAARAALLAGLAALLHLRQRYTDPIALLAATCVAVLWLDPWAILQPGAWLSACALAGALLATRWSDRALGTGWGWRMLSASVGATLATAPITAAGFGMVSLAGIGLNFVAIPLAALGVPGLLFSLLAAALFPPLAPPLAAGSGALLGLVEQLAWWGGRLDAAVVVGPAEPAAALPWLAILALAAWGMAGGTTRSEALRRWALAGAVLIWGSLAREQLGGADDTSGLTLHFLDVGQGDAALIRTPGGHWVAVDAGPRGDGWDAGRRVVVPFLQQHHVARLDLALLSHAHADHIGGLAAVVDRVPVGQVLDPADLVADPLYAGLLGELAAREVRWQAARAGLHFTLDSVRFTVLHPDTSWPGWQEDLNEDSIVLLLEYQGFRVVFAGDAGLPVEARLAAALGPVDLLKLGHHGSRSATGEAWLTALQPRAAVISVGRQNRYGHPHPEVLERLARHAVSLWRTDRDGSVTAGIDQGVLTLRARGRRERFPVRGAPGKDPRKDDP